ncbi:hypothetical protein [Bradyrhizobium sp. BTAi1]|jgi:hypothetical protein|uniref:hypothetical protein n=1 Tax=Bradyrhizobium sp. (strain BTAi1 / ATCC BAA-1182) TaxID=288000 RepID=UPI00005DDD0C|nr:hypothetical protein [Bradyrhizobium sp. BTAi1]ABQ37392.1 hypothetical protein BBta_5420 [Bradyrhizobium sp. BTAi1]
MNSMDLHGSARRPLRREPAADRSVAEAAWLVLEAANELGDEDAVAACRRVIDAGLNGAKPLPRDLDLVGDYFR